MKEFRFATQFIFFFFIFLISSLHLGFSQSNLWLVLTCIILFILLLYTGKNFYTRSIQFSERPTVPFENVSNNIALKFNDYAEKLGLRNASLLTPDCGGTLFYSKLRVFDMAGLIDKRYALVTLGKNNNAFYNLVFEIDKPTFIEIHSDWSYHINLQDDPRFYRDYVSLIEEEVWLYGKNIKKGHYVRRDAIGNDMELLKKIRDLKF